MNGRREFLSARQVSDQLGFSLKALAEWRKRKIGPRFRRAYKDNPQSRPRYYREDVEALRAALLVVRGMGLRAFPNAPGPDVVAPASLTASIQEEPSHL